MFCTRPRSCARADDAKSCAVRMHNAKLGNHLKAVNFRTFIRVDGLMWGQRPCTFFKHLISANGFFLYFTCFNMQNMSRARRATVAMETKKSLTTARVYCWQAVAWITVLEYLMWLI